MKHTTRLLGTLAIAGTSLFFLFSFFSTNEAEKKTPPSLAPVQSTSAEVPKKTKVRVQASYGKLPLHFEPNQGQTDPKVKFLSRGSGYTLFLTPTEAILALRKPKEKPEAGNGEAEASPDEAAEPESTVLRMRLVGANTTPKVSGLEELPGKSNYFIGNDPAKWRTNVPNYARVKYEGIYPGIDLVYYGNQRQLEYDFVVAPGADPSAIRLAFQGAEKLSLGKEGNLVLHTAGGEVLLRAPVVYQEVDGTKQTIPGRYTLHGKDQVVFHVEAYDTRRPLVIDPVLVYSTYLGGSSDDFGAEGAGIAVDGAGNAYVTGWTKSIDFPTVNPLQSAGGALDAFVAKLDADGSALVYSTYLGGSSDDFGDGIAVDGAGNAYVTGRTESSDFPTVAPLQAASGGSGDAFVAKLSTVGSGLVYSTYLGGSSSDVGNGIAVDSSGNAYVTGSTASADFPTEGSLQSVSGGGVDAFVAKLNSGGSALVYSTYLGGSGEERGFGIDVDPVGNAYVTGRTASADFPTEATMQAAFGGGAFDAFVAKLNAPGSALVYSTYLGGSGFDQGVGIALDGSGSAYVTGRTRSVDFPTEAPLQPAHAGGELDAFVAKIGEEEVIITVAIDIKPGSCPNPLNVKSKGVLTVAILGTEDFDVTNVDPTTVLLAGVPILNFDYEDVATPFDPFTGRTDALDCTDEGPDGEVDLTMKFAKQAVVTAIGAVNDGDEVVLTLEGELTDGTPIVGEDVVVIKKKGKP